MKNNYSLALTVGIKNLFSSEAKAIQKSQSELTRSNRGLQRSLDDVSAYETANAELLRLASSSNVATADIRRQERAVSRLAQRLSNAGIDTRELTQEQHRLEQQLQSTTQAASRLSNIGDGLSNLTAMAGGVGAAGALAGTGHVLNQIERNVAARTGKSLEQVQASRDDRLAISHDTGLTDAQVIEMQVQAEQAGYSDDDALNVTRTSAEMASVFKELEPREIMAAQTRMMKEFGINAEKSAGLLMAMAQKAGDDKGEMLDTVMEYSSTLSHGLDAESFIATLIAGKKSGAWKFDKIGDALKESFQARLSDPTEFKKLVGKGKEKGVLDEFVKDPKQALDMKNSLYAFRAAYADGDKTKIAPAYARIMTELAKIYQTDKGAARNVAEGIGGTIMAEDIGFNQIIAMAKALQNPSSVLGETSGILKKAIEQNLTPLDQFRHSLTANVSAMSTVFSDIENAAESFIDSMSDKLHGSAGAMNNNSGLAGIASALAIGVAGAASWAALKGAKNLGRLLTGRQDNSPTTRNHRRLSSYAPRGAGGVMTLLGGAQAVTSIVDGDLAGAAGGVGMAGGALAGMKLGGILGAIGGPLGVAAGGAAGSVIGGILGEQALSGIANWGSNLFEDEKETNIGYVESLTEQLEKKSDETSSQNNAPYINMPLSVEVKAEAGSVVPDDLEDKLNTILRERSHEFMQQLREALNAIEH